MLKVHYFLASLALAVWLSFLGGAGQAQAGEVQVGWSDLVPEVEPYDDPFRDLTYDQIRDLRIVLLGEDLDDQVSYGLAGKFQEARSRLEAAGLDIDYLAKQREVVMQRREQAAVSTNKELEGAEVRIPGYLLPLRVENRKITEFLLVPSVGACIHTPPPPPNQLIHVRYPEGFKAEGLYTPIWVSGRLEAVRTMQTVNYSDGVTPVDVAYRLEAADIELY